MLMPFLAIFVFSTLVPGFLHGQYHGNHPSGSRAGWVVAGSFAQAPLFALKEQGPVSGPSYSGFVRRSQLHGPWRSWYPNGRLLDSGLLKDGVPDGKWMRWDSAGRLLSVRHYDAKKWRRIQSEFRLNHPRRWTYALAGIYRRNRQEAILQLQGWYSFQKMQEERMAATPGQWVAHNAANPAAYLPVFRECLQHGIYVNYHPNGSMLDSGIYHNGLREAVWIEDAGDENWWIGAYQNGKRIKEWKKFSRAGKLLAIYYYNRKGK